MRVNRKAPSPSDARRRPPPQSMARSRHGRRRGDLTDRFSGAARPGCRGRCPHPVLSWTHERAPFRTVRGRSGAVRAADVPNSAAETQKLARAGIGRGLDMDDREQELRASSMPHAARRSDGRDPPESRRIGRISGWRRKAEMPRAAPGLSRTPGAGAVSDSPMFRLRRMVRAACPGVGGAVALSRGRSQSDPAEARPGLSDEETPATGATVPHAACGTRPRAGRRRGAPNRRGCDRIPGGRTEEIRGGRAGWRGGGAGRAPGGRCRAGRRPAAAAPAPPWRSRRRRCRTRHSAGC